VGVSFGDLGRFDVHPPAALRDVGRSPLLLARVVEPLEPAGCPDKFVFT